MGIFSYSFRLHPWRCFCLCGRRCPHWRYLESLPQIGCVSKEMHRYSEWNQRWDRLMSCALAAFLSLAPLAPRFLSACDSPKHFNENSNQSNKIDLFPTSIMKSKKKMNVVDFPYSQWVCEVGKRQKGQYPGWSLKAKFPSPLWIIIWVWVPPHHSKDSVTLP